MRMAVAESYEQFLLALNLPPREMVGPVDVLGALQEADAQPSPPRGTERVDVEKEVDEQAGLPDGIRRDPLDKLASLRSGNFVADECGAPPPVEGPEHDEVLPFTTGVDEESILSLLPD
jgi:hypothetical protein